MAENIRIGGMQIRFLHSKHDTGGALDMFEVSIPANIRMPVPHYHRDWEETVYGMEGTTTFTVAGKRINVAPGETLFIPRGVIQASSTRRKGRQKCFAC